MNRSERPGPFTGWVVSLFLTVALVSLFYAGQRAIGFPSPPFDLFDGLTRALPGAVVTFGIDSLVGIVRRLGLGPTSQVAKTAEQLLAIAIFLFVCVSGGALLFAVLRRRAARPARAGLALGLAFAVPMALIGLAVARPSPVGAFAGSAWTSGLFVLWGLGHGWSFARLAGWAGPVVEDRGADVGPPSHDAGPDQIAVGGARVERVDRRTFLIRLGGATAVVTVAGAAVGALAEGGSEPTSGPPETRWSAMNPLPNRGATPSPARGTRPEFTPLEDHYRIDINTTPPVIEETDWALDVGGLVDRPTRFTLEELRTGWEPLHQFVTLECISNPIAGDLIGTQRWTGVPVRRLLERVAPVDAATHVRVDAADGFYEVVPLEAVGADERIMLTYAWDGVPLPREHGFPLRIYIPGRYGMKQPKWIERMRAIDEWEAGYWVERGWSREAIMKTTSVIDTVAVDMTMGMGDEGGTTIPVGGIAFAGDRGVSRVEVRVDDGPWEEAALREPLSDKTWAVWRYEWTFEEGTHTFTVRCTDGDGRPQVADMTPVRPDGATGLHSVERML